jgi:hypothetical protein
MTDNEQARAWPPVTGTKVRLDYGDGNPNNTLWHVRGHADDCVVMRRWRPAKQRWHYEVMDDVWWDVFVIRSESSTVEVPND